MPYFYTSKGLLGPFRKVPKAKSQNANGLDNYYLKVVNFQNIWQEYFVTVQRSPRLNDVCIETEKSCLYLCVCVFNKQFDALNYLR